MRKIKNLLKLSGASHSHVVIQAFHSEGKAHLCDTSEDELNFQYLDSLRNLENFIADKDEDTLFRFFRRNNSIEDYTVSKSINSFKMQA